VFFLWLLFRFVRCPPPSHLNRYAMEREWRVALDAAAVAHGIRCGVRGNDLKTLAREEQSRWHCYKKELFPGSALVAVLLDAHNGKAYCANVGDCMAALIYPPEGKSEGLQLPPVNPSAQRSTTPPPPESGQAAEEPRQSDERSSSMEVLRGHFNIHFPDINGGDPAPNEEIPSPEFGRCVLLSRPHKPADMCELKRVCETPNGFVEVHGQRVTPENSHLVAEQVAIAHSMGRKALYRINRDVSLSRAIGDFDLREFGVVATPDVTVFEMSDTTTSALLVIASDGVWDVMSASQVMEIVDADPVSNQLHQQLNDQGNSTQYSYSCTQLAQSLAHRVVNSAFDIKKNNDDVTAIVAGLSLNPKASRRAPPQVLSVVETEGSNPAASS